MASLFERVRSTVVLFDEDPDLSAGIADQQLAAARRQAQAAVLEIEGPTWDTADIREAATDGWLGLFVLEGLMLRRVTVGKRPACELFGPGDVIRPWDADGDYSPLPITVDWVVLEPGRLAVLDGAFALRVARWPSITSRLMSRIAQRARYLALTQAVTHLPRTYSRLLILFWLLAERWGRVRPDGVSITLPLTHEVLAMLVGAHRPTVTTALQRLAHAGLLTREGADRWLLTTLAIESLEQPESVALIEAHADHASNSVPS
jgi:CRP-like cAMP-binding protein